MPSKLVIPLLILPLSIALNTGVASAENEFYTERSSRQYMPEKNYDLLHIKLEPEIDIASGSVRGVVTHTLVPLYEGVTKVVFHAAELEIQTVRLNGSVDLPFYTAEEELQVTLDQAYGPSDTLVIAIEYEAAPRMGLYFVRPSDDYPDKPYQVWSQGEAHENRHWFPLWDYPNDKLTSEMIVTVDRGMIALSNGALVDSGTSGGQTTFHWKEDVPHVSYLISLVIGEYVEVKDQWDGIPISYFVRPKDERFAQLTFGRTPEMVKLFSEVLGVRYPYEKYAQICVDDFIWGGMENISATTMTRRILHDKRAHEDYQAEGIVSHELAHQWFGDLLTTHNWGNAWLNEGFADYFEIVWAEHDRGPDESQELLNSYHEAYHKEDSERYRRPIVTTTYEYPLQMFDRHTYQKGALVLHMLRSLLGDNLWWTVMHEYVQSHYGQTVITEDLRATIERVTGRPFDWFFDEWVYHAGHPEYEVGWDWSDDTKLIEVTVRQIQRVDSLTPLFRMPVEIVASGEFGERSFTVDVNKTDQSYFFPAPSRPSRVEFDPQDIIIKELTFEKEPQELVDQLRNSPSVASRRRAAIWLGKRVDFPVAERALTQALNSESFWGVRVACARALSNAESSSARDALIRALNDERSEVRAASAKALGSFPESGATVNALERVFHTDLSYKTQAEALKALAKIGVKGAYKKCQEALKVKSYREWIRSAAFDALITLKDKRGIDLALKWSGSGKPIDARTTAVKALGKLGAIDPERKTTIRERLERLVVDPSHRVRFAAVAALGELKDKAAIPGLTRVLEREPRFQMKQAVRRALRKIAEAASTTNAELIVEMDSLKKERRALQKRVTRLEESLQTPVKK